MRLLLVDDHEVVRRGVRSLLLERSGCEICGEAIDGQDAVEKARELKPDLIVMDVSMPRLNGLEATRRIHSFLPMCEVLILSQHESPEMARQALKAGARGYVVKSSISKDLISALSKVARGEYFFDPAILDQNSSSHIDVQEILQRSSAFEHALRESEELYRSTFELTAVGIAHVSASGQWLRVNKKLCEIVGYSEPELLRTTFLEITHPDDLNADLSSAEKVRKREIDTYSLEKRYFRKDGSLIWINLTVSGVWDASGLFKHFISVIEDISDRKRVEEALRDSQTQLAFALESSKTAMFDWDLVDQRGTWNPQMEAIYGFNPKDFYITVEEWRSLIHPDDRARLTGEAERVWREGERFNFEFRTIRPDGQLKWILSNGRIVRDVTGTALRMIGTHSDITDRKRIGEELATGARQQRALFHLADDLQRAQSPGEIYDAALSAILDALQCNRASILLCDDAGVMKFQSWRGLSEHYRNAVEGHSAWAPGEQNPRPVCINDINLAEISESLKSTVKKEGIASLAFIPLVANGKLIGKFMAYFNTAHEFSYDELELAVTIARHLAFAIDRKRSDEAVRKSEESFRAIVETTPECVKLVARDGTLLHMNSSGLRMVGADRAEGVVGKSVYDVVAPEDRERFKAFNERICSGEKGSLEFEIVGLNGQRRYMETHAAPLRNPNGTIVQLAVTREVTERKQAEEVTGHLAAIVASSDDAIVSKNLNGIIKSWNKGAEQIFGYSAEETIGQHISLIIPDERHSEEAEIIRRLQRGERMEHFHTVRRRKDGKLLDVSLTISPVCDSSGRVIGASKVARDITAQKQAETALRESEQRFRAITETSPVMVWMSGTDKGCYYFNKVWLDFVGRTLEEEAGHGWTENVHPDDYKRCVQIYTESFEARRPFEMEYRLRHHTGQYRWIIDRGVPRYTPDEIFEGYVGGCLDLHEQKEAADKIRIADYTLRLMKIQDEERRRIARELHDSAGQTLTVLGLNLAQLVQRSEELAPELVAEGKQIEQIVQQLQRDIRTTSYLLHPPLLDEAGLSSALDWYVQGIVERSNLSIDLTISDDFGRLPADMELAIFRVVQECLTNVHRHSGSPTASLRLAREDGNVSIEVHDDGKGIPPERLSEIETRGSGVGIRGIRERLNQFNGDMKIESNGSGTKVSVTIPLPKEARERGAETLKAAV